jgi:hypothetical protein
MDRKLEDGHGEFFAGLVHDLVAQSGTLYPERFDPLVEELGRFIEMQSPAVLIPGYVDCRVASYYGSMIPRGHAGVVLVDGKTMTQEGRPSVTCMTTFFDSQYAEERREYLCDLPKEKAVGMSLYSVKDVLETDDTKERERKSESVIHSLFGILQASQFAEKCIENGFVPATVILYAAEGSLFCCACAVAVAMPGDMVRAVYAGESA